MGLVEDGELFLSLDEEDIPSPRPAPAVKKIPEPVEDTSFLLAEVIDTSLIQEATGSFAVSWPLLGMDCPDCAAKAMGALRNMKQVSDANVSATSGEVRLSINLEQGTLSDVSSVLRSLGHAPDVEHHELVGVRASSVAHRNNVQKNQLEKVLKRQPGILDVEIGEDDRILVQLVNSQDPGLLESRNQALNHILGVTPKFTVTSSSRVRPDQWRLIGAGIAVPILLLAFIAEFVGLDGMLIGILAIPGIAIGGFQMFREAIASLKNLQMGFQVLTSLAVIGAAVLGMWEEALIVTILVAFTAHLEGNALLKAREAMQGGLDRLPRTARRVHKSKALCITPEMKISTIKPLPMARSSSLTMAEDLHIDTELVPIDLIQVGDTIEIRSGELIPADGRIIEGQGALDKAPLTGESVPVDVAVGDLLEAGLVLARGPVICEVLAVGDATRLSGLIDAVHTFREAPPRLQNSIEKFTSIWVPLVLFGAFAVWFFMFPDDWKIILLLWVVSCPCALLLATPVPHAAALSNAAQKGVIVRGGDALERLGRVNHTLLDKTGTLTSGRPKIGHVILAKKQRIDSVLQMMMGLEARSSHPYALAILEYGHTQGLKGVTITDVSDIDAGVEGTHNGEKVSFLRPDKAQALGVEMDSSIYNAFQDALHHGHGASVLVKQGRALGLVSFVHDDTRAGSQSFIQQMQERSINVEILSGDHQHAVSEFARSVGLQESAAHGGLSPEDKVKWVKARSSSHVTMMVGDGFNDAAALAVADVGVAVGTGESVNLEAADILIPGDDPRILTEMIDLARQAQRTLMQNLFFSVAITITLVFAVIQQWYHQLWVGVLIHEASVILVILNGARLAQHGQTLPLLKDIFATMIHETSLAFRTFKTRYFSSASSKN